MRGDRIEKVFTGSKVPEEIIAAQDEQMDGQGCYCFPGMIDLHFHGCKGYDFCDGTREAVEEIARYEASHRRDRHRSGDHDAAGGRAGPDSS